MVQKQTRRRSSLIMGAMLALLLGVAAGFVVLGMPTHLLEAITTFTHLSKLMTQAEPPIMPYDKSVLAVLAGTLTAGIGWVLVDWLLFGRAGMRTLIREREDDYEDGEGESFRSTDPLDLVVPASLPTGDWAPQQAADARRPLSARTDVGEPPSSSFPPGLQPGPMPGIDQLLPPIEQILPGSGRSAPAARPAPAPDPFPSLGIEPPPGSIFGGPSLPPMDRQPAASWPPAEAPDAASPARPAPVASSWLPTPGVRPDGSTSQFDFPSPHSGDEGDPDDDDLPAQQPWSMPDPFGHTPPPLPLSTPEPPPLFTPPATPPALAPLPEPNPASAPTLQPAAPPPLAFDPPAPPLVHPPAFEPPAPAFTQPPAFEPPAQPAAQPLAFEPQVQPAADAPIPAAATRPAPAPPRSSPEPTFAGMDKARLEDLLVRLERGLQARKAAAAARAAAMAEPVPTAQPQMHPQQPQPQPQQQVAPQQPPVTIPQPSPAHTPINFPASEPLAAFAPPEPTMSFEPPKPVMPPAGFSAPIPQPVAPTTAPVYDLPTAPAYNLAPRPPVADDHVPAPRIAPVEPASDELLDQPLHVTLDLLRNKVKR